MEWALRPGRHRAEGYPEERVASATGKPTLCNQNPYRDRESSSRAATLGGPDAAIDNSRPRWTMTWTTERGSGTPTFVINAHLVNGARPVHAPRSIMNEQLGVKSIAPPKELAPGAFLWPTV